MVVATLRHGQLTIIDRLRETVRLAEGLRSDTGLAPAARTRAIDCLQRFGERLREMRADNVRAAGTNSMRRIRNDGDFLNQAQQALGHRIDIIAGVEEARLIYLGVTHSLPPPPGRRLVLDIGGGSTELIVGEGRDAIALESLGMGCVGKTELFFPDGRITAERFEEARVAARLKLRPVKAVFRKSGWDAAIGASGTVRSTVTVAREMGLIKASERLHVSHLESLIETMIGTGHIDKLDLPGLSQRRAQVWPGGLSILVELMHTLRIESLLASDGSMREGVLYDLVGRLQHDDARVRSVIALGERYHIDQQQAARVKETAMQLFDQVADHVSIETSLARLLLRWAAHLHEIGLDIAHADFHLHGAYIVANADLPGFPAAEQQLLAYVLSNQRKRPSGNSVPMLDASWQSTARLLTLLLRLAVLINRNRSDAPMQPVSIGIRDDTVRVSFDPVWLDNNPLTRADLAREQQLLANWSLKLEFD